MSGWKRFLLEGKRVITILEPEDSAYERFCQRLRQDFELDDEAVQLIVNLRNQVADLQARLTAMQADMQSFEADLDVRVTRYREVYYEAEWEEMDDEE